VTAGPEASRRGLTARALLAVIRFYRTAISPALPPSCRYTPSCSAYAVEAIEVHGAGRGSWLAVRRLLRCHHFHAGGHDPVPPPVARAVSRTPTSAPRAEASTAGPVPFPSGPAA